MTEGWIGVDLDGTLAEYHGWQGPEHIGAPISAMVERVKAWLAEGACVRIMTARVSDDVDGRAHQAIDAWCKEHLGQTLEVTCRKDYEMVELWDDRCVQIEPNTGAPVQERVRDLELRLATARDIERQLKRERDAARRELLDHLFLNQHPEDDFCRRDIAESRGWQGLFGEGDNG